MLWWTAQNVLVTAMLCGIVWAASRLLRIGPVGRHALWLIVLIKLLTPPLVVWPWAIPGRIGNSEPLSISESQVSLAPSSTVAPDDNWIAPPQTATESFGPAPLLVPHQKDVFAPPPAHRLGWLLPLGGAVWLAGGLGIALIQFVRVLWMRRHVRCSMVAPPELTQRVSALSARLGIRPVGTRVVFGIGSPLIWSLGRPQLLWPAELDPAGMRGDSLRGLILHELAHVRRRDHWVAWLELAAGCLWWWNPLFWYVRHQLRENAELACDGWVVQTLPAGRRAYAEALLAVCEFISRRTNPMPAVGVSTGGRRFLERRLAMILRERTPLRLSRSGLLVLGLLAATALPVWSQKSPDADSEKPGEPRSGFIAEALGRISGAARAEDPAKADEPGYEAPRDSGAETLFADVVGRLQTLRDLYSREGRIDDARSVSVALRALERTNRSGSSQVRPDPGTLTAYRGRVGETFVFAVTGSTEGMVWGSDVYTDDSALAVAAVHAGIVQPGRHEIVKVTILPGRSNYEGSNRNGVESTSYGPWTGSYRVEPLRVASNRVAPGAIAPDDLTVLHDPNTLLYFRDRVGQSFTFDVTGSAEGNIWGSGVYTDDSPLAVAAVHAGVLRPGVRGRIRVTILPGGQNYEGSTRNGITSLSYGPFQGSYRIDGLRRTLLPGGGVTPTLEHLRDQVGRTINIDLTGSTEGSVWGSGVYTDDSSLPAAAVHAGALQSGERGRVAVTILPGRDHYDSSTRNGVSSGSWGSWQGSFRIQRATEEGPRRTF